MIHGRFSYTGFSTTLTDTTAYLIEMNPRSTQLGHLRLGPGSDLVGALNARLAGLPLRASLPVTTH
ncbi:MAG TPA: hypothetical protein VMW56_28530, partial [Candidatus Margulisiibacteriota bacterium]|nr:hypothetical protein [Candidatus Margulisiibacteriota bacterium]